MMMHKKDLFPTLLFTFTITQTNLELMEILIKFIEGLVNTINEVLIVYIKINHLWSMSSNCSLYIYLPPDPRNSIKLA